MQGARSPHHTEDELNEEDDDDDEESSDNEGVVTRLTFGRNFHDDDDSSSEEDSESNTLRSSGRGSSGGGGGNGGRRNTRLVQSAAPASRTRRRRSAASEVPVSASARRAPATRTTGSLNRRATMGSVLGAKSAANEKGARPASKRQPQKATVSLSDDDQLAAAPTPRPVSQTSKPPNTRSATQIVLPDVISPPNRKV